MATYLLVVVIPPFIFFEPPSSPLRSGMLDFGAGFDAGPPPFEPALGETRPAADPDIPVFGEPYPSQGLPAAWDLLMLVVFMPLTLPISFLLMLL
jgi:hypothetical protein